ncbi:MAG: Tat pathway signal sequence domain protein [Bryobacteraceae bacterium]
MMRRRTFLSTSAVTGLELAARRVAAAQSSPAGQSGPVSVGWLGGTSPLAEGGISWGVPWARGAVRKDQSFTLTGTDGKALPLQAWPLAYWPDGSLKWSGFATVASAGAAGPFRVAPGPSGGTVGGTAVTVRQSANAIDIDTGRLQCRLPRQGPALIDSMTIEGRVVARQGRLVCTLEDHSDPDLVRLEHFGSTIKQVTAEQTGPVRAVVKIEGAHKAEKGNREWLPFTVRLYFYGGQAAVRMVHSIVFDGDQEKDFIRGLGVVFQVPMREQIHNRHVRFSAEGEGLWSEPLEPLTGARGLATPGAAAAAPGGRGAGPGPGGPPGGEMYALQLAGQRVPNKEQFNQQGQFLLNNWAVWDSFKLVQPTADGFQIQKRTNPQSCWLFAGAGKRASGLVFTGDVSGGLAVAVKNFWQSHPASLEVLNATQDAADLRVWLWSPDAPAMDLRHYDTRNHTLEASYEDVQPGFSTANGIGRTSELTLYPSASVPAKEDTTRQARTNAEPPLLVCTPQHYHTVSAFGPWSLPDRSTALKRAVEDQLDGAVELYRKEVEQRHWYGFWDYGDVMHAQDPARHTWRYDIGGYAWDNTELGTDMWLWYSFLRTGRADIFRMAEAMTRHTSEVDTYHSGRFAGLGSRHNVRHWGCGAKEARISQAAFRRFHYYLTTDERTGDIMRDVVDVDGKYTELDPMRLASPRTGPIPYPARIRGGPDWLACAGNWMTEWERTGNTKYRDKILVGMDSIAKMPYGFMTGPNTLYGYDPKTGMLYPLVPDGFGVYNLQVIQGGAEVAFELNQLIDHAGWQKAFLQYCRLTGAPKDVAARDVTTGAEGSDGAYAGVGRLAAYAYSKTRNTAFIARAVAQLGAGGGGFRRLPGGPYATQHVAGPDVMNPIDEAPGVSTNSTAQNSLTAIQVLELCKDQLPAELPPAPTGGRGRGGRG